MRTRIPAFVPSVMACRRPAGTERHLPSHHGGRGNALLPRMVRTAALNRRPQTPGGKTAEFSSVSIGGGPAVRLSFKGGASVGQHWVLDHVNG